MNKVKVPLEVGKTVRFSKTITETDVVMFAGITGDFSRFHTNEQFMQTTKYGKRMAHGVLSFAVGVTCTTLIQNDTVDAVPAVSYGFDKVRFIKPVFFGDTLNCAYTITEVDDKVLKSYGKLEIYNQKNEIVAAAIHILKFIPFED